MVWSCASVGRGCAAQTKWLAKPALGAAPMVKLAVRHLEALYAELRRHQFNRAIARSTVTS
jgi:hypothetical protein